MIPVSVKKELEDNGWKRVCKYEKQEELFIKGFWCIKDSRGKTDIYKGWNLHTETGILYLNNIPGNKLIDFAKRCDG